MTGKIESITATIPVTGQSYTDLRPTVSADSPEEYRELLATVGELAGNAKFVERMRGQVDEQTGASGAPVSSQSILGDGVLFNKEDHTYSKNGKPYLSGSTFAHMFEKEFPRDAIAQKVADKNDRTVEDVLAGWDSKGEISLQYGTLIHKCIETFVKYGETPNNEYLAGIVGDWNEVFGDSPIDFSELFIQDDVHQLCGVADAVGDYTLYDWKTGDIHKKTSHTLGKEFPNDRLSLYTLQLNFYRYIIEQNGGKINHLVIGWLNGEHWEKVKVDVIDIRPYLEEVWKPTK